MASQRLNLKILETGGQVVMRLNGCLDGSGACQVEQALQQLQKEARGKKLRFDLGGVRKFEYFGIALLARGIKSQKGHFQEVVLTGLRAPTDKVFRRFGLEAVVG